MLIQIAGFTICIETLSILEKEFQTGYLKKIADMFPPPSNAKVDFCISIKHRFPTPNNFAKKFGSNFFPLIEAPFYIDYQERRMAIEYTTGPDPVETILIPRLRFLIALLLSQKKGLLLHSSAVAIADKVHVFLGKSGSGKTTISRILAHKGVVLSDECNALLYTPDGWEVYATPFTKSSEIDFCSSRQGSIAALYMLKKAPYNKLISTSITRSIAGIIQSVVSAKSVAFNCGDFMLSICDELVHSVPVYTLDFINNKTLLSLFSPKKEVLFPYEVQAQG
jgi:hypothetical protein